MTDHNGEKGDDLLAQVVCQDENALHTRDGSFLRRRHNLT